MPSESKCLNLGGMYSTLNNLELVNALKPLIANQRVLISGASGWLGKNLIELILDLNENIIPSSILLTATSDKVVQIYGDRKVEIKKWDRKSIKDFQPTVFINLAFLTRDKLLTFPICEYIKINQEIINEALWVARLPTVKYVLSTSSGAAENIFETGDIESDPYGKLKKIEEIKLKRVSDDSKKSLLILRVWTVSGKYIKLGDLLVLQSLISKLKNDEDFEITSGGKVFRSFIHAYEMLGLAILALLTGKTGIINSGGIQVELTDLAKIALEVFDSKSRIIYLNSNSSSDSNYISGVPDLNEIAAIHDLEIMDLKSQLVDTSLTIMNFDEPN